MWINAPCIPSDSTSNNLIYSVPLLKDYSQDQERIFSNINSSWSVIKIFDSISSFKHFVHNWEETRWLQVPAVHVTDNLDLDVSAKDYAPLSCCLHVLEPQGSTVVASSMICLADSF